VWCHGVWASSDGLALCGTSSDGLALLVWTGSYGWAWVCAGV
jgi:hypothetical protein